MGAPVMNTRFVGNGTMRQSKSPMGTPQSGGLHDIYAKGQKMYGTSIKAYTWYKTARAIHGAVRSLFEAGLAL